MGGYGSGGHNKTHSQLRTSAGLTAFLFMVTSKGINTFPARKL